MPSSALSYLNTIPTVIQPLSGLITEGQRVLVSLLLVPPSRKQQENERKKRGGGENNGWRGVEERPRQRRRRRRRGKLEQSSRGLFFGGTYIRGHISRLALERPLCLLLRASLSLSLFLHGVCTTMAVRSNVYIHTRGPPRAPPSPYTARRDRDAKETRAAFKLAATKRINSPGSLDLLIRAAVAFLRGLDRWGPEAPRPSCFLAIASAAGRLAPSRRVCTPAVQLASTIVVRAYPASSPPILFHGFSRGVVGAQ